MASAAKAEILKLINEDELEEAQRSAGSPTVVNGV